MLEWAPRGVWLLILVACAASSDSGEAPETARVPALGSPTSNSAQQQGAFASFVDPDTGQVLQDVRDADREIVRFDEPSQSLIWMASGTAVGGWSTAGNDLHWQRSGVAFRVRFGTEAGERRAYFTEADRGTICDLSISAPGQLSIGPTSETPPGS